MTVLCKKPFIRIGALIAEGALISRGGRIGMRVLKQYKRLLTKTSFEVGRLLERGRQIESLRYTKSVIASVT